jgi:hypothetical protein
MGDTPACLVFEFAGDAGSPQLQDPIAESRSSDNCMLCFNPAMSENRLNLKLASTIASSTKKLSGKVNSCFVLNSVPNFKDRKSKCDTKSLV